MYNPWSKVQFENFLHPNKVSLVRSLRHFFQYSTLYNCSASEALVTFWSIFKSLGVPNPRQTVPFLNIEIKKKTRMELVIAKIKQCEISSLRCLSKQSKIWNVWLLSMLRRISKIYIILHRKPVSFLLTNCVAALSEYKLHVPSQTDGTQRIVRVHLLSSIVSSYDSLNDYGSEKRLRPILIVSVRWPGVTCGLLERIFA